MCFMRNKSQEKVLHSENKLEDIRKNESPKIILHSENRLKAFFNCMMVQHCIVFLGYKACRLRVWKK